MFFGVDRSTEFCQIISKLKINDKSSDISLKTSSFSKNQLKNNSEFQQQIVKLLQTIVYLQKELQKIHEEYISIVPTYRSSDRCRKLESNAESLINLCQKCLENIKSDKYINQEISPQMRMYRENIASFIDNKLGLCHKLYDEINGIKLRLKSKKKPKDVISIIDESSVKSSESFAAEENDQDLRLRNLQIEQTMNDFDQTQMNEERQELYKQFEDLGRMNIQFSELVMEQHSTIKRIEETALNSDDNIVSGNKELQSAMRNQSSMRFWSIFVMLVLSFTLLLLDYLNG